MKIIRKYIPLLGLIFDMKGNFMVQQDQLLRIIFLSTALLTKSMCLTGAELTMTVSLW